MQKGVNLVVQVRHQKLLPRVFVVHVPCRSKFPAPSVPANQLHRTHRPCGVGVMTGNNCNVNQSNQLRELSSVKLRRSITTTALSKSSCAIAKVPTTCAYDPETSPPESSLM